MHAVAVGAVVSLAARRSDGMFVVEVDVDVVPLAASCSRGTIRGSGRTWLDVAVRHVFVCCMCPLQVARVLVTGSPVHATFMIHGQQVVAHVGGMWWGFFKEAGGVNKVFRDWVGNATTRHKESMTA
jgi:hypothetical protein